MFFTKIAELTPQQQDLFDENVSYMRGLASKYPQHFEDIYSEALLALFYSVQEFDPAKGVSFKSYVTRAFYNAVTNYFLKLMREKGRDPVTEKQIKDKLLELEDVLDDVRSIPYPVKTEALQELEKEVSDLRRRLEEIAAGKVVPLDKPVGDKEDVALSEILFDIKEIKAEDVVFYDMLKDRLRKELSPRNFQILELLEQGYTNDEISEIIRRPATAEGISYIIVHEIRPVVSRILYETPV